MKIGHMKITSIFKYHFRNDFYMSGFQLSDAILLYMFILSDDILVFGLQLSDDILMYVFQLSDDILMFIGQLEYKHENIIW
jgi:hypothetical protein